jgi:hypothetical protein
MIYLNIYLYNIISKVVLIKKILPNKKGNYISFIDTYISYISIINNKINK